MRHPWMVPALLAFALVGYAIGTLPVQAQTERVPLSADPFPLAIGEIVTLTFPGGASRTCSIDEVKATFARCGTAQRQTLSIGQNERPEEWVNLAQVEWITKRRRDR